MIKNEECGAYIYNIMERDSLNGDSYIKADELYKICASKNPGLAYEMFIKELEYQIVSRKIHKEDSNYYLSKVWKYEKVVAAKLMDILKNNNLGNHIGNTRIEESYENLCQEQKEAVTLAASNRLTIITGGAGSGKTTVIKAIVKDNGVSGYGCVLCAPTGKAARNLSERVGLPTRTVHGVLGVRSDGEFISFVAWENVKLVIVDEASMLTLEMLAGILCKVRNTCRIVLLGDPNQLQSVGIGNVIPDLLSLGIPSINLNINHRQEPKSKALTHNVTKFPMMNKLSDFLFDESFKLVAADEKSDYTLLIQEAAKAYIVGNNIQVITPFKTKSNLSVKSLNEAIRELVNPDYNGKKRIEIFGEVFRDGDRVMIIQNDAAHDCCNGDIGIIRINDDEHYFSIDLLDGRYPKWSFYEKPIGVTLAYALTIHKAQGSEYDTVLIPLSRAFSCMLTRNLLYTAIARAKTNIIFFGNIDAFSMAIKNPARIRRSSLTKTVKWYLRNNAHKVA